MWSNILLISLLIICVVTDLRERKIYNKVLFPFVVVSLTSHLIFDGWSGLAFASIGMLVGFVILLIPYLLNGMGAGDVKLLAVVGAIKGINFVLITSVYMAIIGGVIGIFILLFRKGFGKQIKQIYNFLILLIQGIKTPFLFDKEALSITYPYGVAIALGALGALFEANGGFFR
jgi:prepilin peptidase CpaA